MNENEVEATHVTDGSTGSSNKDISETGSTPNPKTSENGAECLHCQDKLEKEEMDEIIDTEFPKKAESLSEVHLKTDTDHSQNPSESKNNSISISKDDEHMIKFKQNDHKQRHTSDKHISEPFSKENEIRDLRDDDIFFETLKMSRVLEDRLTEIPGALEYIKKLHHLIDKHIKKIRKLRKKLNEQTTKNCKDSFTQTDVEHPVLAVSVSEVAEKEVKIEVESKPKSLAEDIAEAAEMAVQNSGFVYEETSGMYYDYNTGYYYNAEYGLYYDGSTGTYMNYNQDTQSYEFHSQVCVADNRQPEKKTNHQKRKNKGKTAKVNPISCDLSSLEQSFSRLRLHTLRSTALGTYALSNTLYYL
ncbi:unnamed protein product [Acanthoscelides obtectus]|uniref:OCRE domain-containing protein n=1 Tax=Acanthoscelides obtectus TaxID=200917 RepID=A0A9P0NZQ5_ACAOB|nr:unnamed protein product [Acanthoscelides obtectus]CAK1656991.1 Angiogenic factor with G patch and FHA domains 1 [Acanthoscelides obtectus]